jgi:hypothetical protein
MNIVNKISIKPDLDGVSVFVHSPILGKMIRSSMFIQKTFYKNALSLNNDAIHYFATDNKEIKNKICQNCGNTRSFMLDSFYYILKNTKKSIKVDNFIDISGYPLYDGHTLNISCLFDSDIENGKTFRYTGVYNSSLIKSINDLLIVLMEKFIKKNI